MYKRYGLRTFTIGFVFAVFGSIIVFLIESKFCTPPQFYINLFAGNISQRETQAIDTLVPRIAFIYKFGTHLAVVALYTAAFSDDTIFPPEKRASAIGYCQLFARIVTAFAPEITELKPPMPILIFLVFNTCALMVSFTFSNQSDKNEKEEKED